jgi:hypothetical protein
LQPLLEGFLRILVEKRISEGVGDDTEGVESVLGVGALENSRMLPEGGRGDTACGEGDGLIFDKVSEELGMPKGEESQGQLGIDDLVAVGDGVGSVGGDTGGKSGLDERSTALLRDCAKKGRAGVGGEGGVDDCGGHVGVAVAEIGVEREGVALGLGLDPCVESGARGLGLELVAKTVHDCVSVGRDGLSEHGEHVDGGYTRRGVGEAVDLVEEAVEGGKEATASKELRNLEVTVRSRDDDVMRELVLDGNSDEVVGRVASDGREDTGLLVTSGSEENFSRVEVTTINDSIIQVILRNTTSSNSKLKGGDEVTIAGGFECSIDQILVGTILVLQVSDLSRRH